MRPHVLKQSVVSHYSGLVTRCDNVITIKAHDRGRLALLGEPLSFRFFTQLLIYSLIICANRWGEKSSP